MARFTLNVLSTDELKQVITDLLATNEHFYHLVIELANLTDSDAGKIEPDDLTTFREYLDDDTTYYTAELLYMAQVAMDGVAEHEDPIENIFRPRFDYYI